MYQELLILLVRLVSQMPFRIQRKVDMRGDEKLTSTPFLGEDDIMYICISVYDYFNRQKSTKSILDKNRSVFRNIQMVIFSSCLYNVLFFTLFIILIQIFFLPVVIPLFGVNFTVYSSTRSCLKFNQNMYNFPSNSATSYFEVIQFIAYHETTNRSRDLR